MAPYHCAQVKIAESHRLKQEACEELNRFAGWCKPRIDIGNRVLRWLDTEAQPVTQRLAGSPTLLMASPVTSFDKTSWFVFML
jgi:hypothetical protein